MAESLHPAASHHLPAFITAPGETDVLMVVMAFILGLSVLAFGILFLTLHTLPERIAHKSHKLQFEIVAVLGLIALFTHMHIFWIAGLLLALIDIPDFGGSLGRIAGATEKIAGGTASDRTAGGRGAAADAGQDEDADAIPLQPAAAGSRSERPVHAKPKGQSGQKELSHA